MNYLILGLLFFLSGFLMKTSDDAYDVNGNLSLAIVFGILCGIASGIAAIFDFGAAYVFIGILIGNLLALKVDGIHHLITLVIFVLICLICGLPSLSITVLLVSVLAALSDEIGHELISKVSENVFVNMFFEYRFVMKIVIFLLALCGAFSFWTFIFFILFEVSYLMGGYIFKK